MQNAHSLGIVFHLTNGQTLNYCCPEQKTAMELIDSLNPLRLFSEKQLVISSNDSTTRIFFDDACCVEFNTLLSLNKWSFPSHIENIMTLSKDKFLKAIETELEDPEVVNDPGQRIRPISIYIQMLMRDDSEWYLRFFSDALKPLERTELARVVRDLTGFHAIKPDGSAILFNFKNVISSVTYPTALLASKKVWKADRLN